MRMVILRSHCNERALPVVVVLITQVPVETPVNPESKPCFRRLKTHRIRGNERRQSAGRVLHSGALSIVFADALGSEKRPPRVQPGRRINEEEVVPHVVEGMTPDR